MATLAVAMKTATHPASGQAIFELADDEMEIGMGQHGEAGTGPSKILTADQTAEMMLSRLVAAVKAKAGDRLLLVINGSGATTLMEMYIVLRGCKKVPGRPGHLPRRGPLRRVAHRPGNGRLPDVRRQNG